ncbi:hypothetical protein AAG570_000928 [Ranatra chinensis]|uniref:Uncharacterized protein n=1 Tax=Ranatra chinensis TaxID=642074 RepID=A0ABD0YYI6_9HEMI
MNTFRFFAIVACRNVRVNVGAIMDPMVTAETSPPRWGSFVGGLGGGRRLVGAAGLRAGGGSPGAASPQAQSARRLRSRTFCPRLTRLLSTLTVASHQPPLTSRVYSDARTSPGGLRPLATPLDALFRIGTSSVPRRHRTHGCAVCHYVFQFVQTKVTLDLMLTAEGIAAPQFAPAERSWGRPARRWSGSG